MRKIMFIFMATCAILAACSKDNTNDPAATADFVQLNPGNYWIWDFYKVDTNGVETKLDHTDSSFIYKDTLINGLQYAVKVSNQIQFTKNGEWMVNADTTFLRDSSGYLVTETGYILFARDNFTDAFHTDTVPGLLWQEYRMTGKDSLVTVPGGTFSTRTMMGVYYPLDISYAWRIRKVYNVYGSGVGLIRFTYGFYSQPQMWEGRLVRYHVQE